MDEDLKMKLRDCSRKIQQCGGNLYYLLRCGGDARDVLHWFHEVQIFAERGIKAMEKEGYHE